MSYKCGICYLYCVLTLSLIAWNASSNFCHLLIIFANSLELWTQTRTDRNSQNVGPDLDPNHLTLIVFLKEFFDKVNFEKKIRGQQKSMKNYLACKELKSFLFSHLSGFVRFDSLRPSQQFFNHVRIGIPGLN